MTEQNANTTILIIDDNPTNLEVLYGALDQAGYKVLVEMDGQRGIAAVQRHQPDLLLLDVMMPGIDGFETCRQLKADPATHEIPIIFMTALSDTADKVKGLAAGAVDYITKPFQQQEVLARIDVHLKLRQANREIIHQKELLEERVQARTAELAAAMQTLLDTQLQLVQREKMASLGNLVAGVAHEINNPIGFLNGSINNAKDYMQDLLDYIALYQHHHPNPAVAVQDKAKNIDLEFLTEDCTKLLDSMKGAIDRIQGISISLRTFSRADTEYKVSANLHECIESTLLILKYRLKANEYRPAIEVVQDYEQIPEIDCFPGQLNQVFMNILANAIDMFDEIAQTQSFAELEANPQQITIRTVMIENKVQISIGDNGKGMSEDVKAKIFEHLFTTKGVGKGTGLGMAIARQIVVEKHGGSLEVQSELGRGTEFCIRLAIAG
ncbi:MAG: response regulator [Synechococcales bacterium]|nr:response regulator [Synechococcales bacterium]